MKLEYNIISSDHPIYDACENGNVEAVNQLLDSGISIYSSAEDKASILAHARCSGSFETYKIFFDRGYDPNHVEGSFNKTELFHVIRIKDIRWLKLLIEKGANVNHRDRYGVTPYHIAAAVGTKEHIDLVLSAGADVLILDDHGEDDFMKAVFAGNIWYAEQLLKSGRDINRKDTSGFTLLIKYAKSGMLDNVKWLLEHGADPNVKDIRNRTALYYAERNKHDQVSDLLRKHGAI
jgi:ankyrin repeat protein